MCSATFRDVNIGGSRWVALASVALALVVTACSSGTDETVVPLTDPTTTSTTAPPTSAPTTTAAPTTTTPTPIVETTVTTTAAPVEPVALPTTDELLTLLQNERDALIDALGEDGDKTGSGLVGLMTPERLTVLVDSIAQRAADGIATKRAGTETVEVVQLLDGDDDSSVVLMACVATDAVVYDVESGEILDDSLIYLLRLVTIVQQDSSWVVADQRRLESGPTPDTCFVN